MPFDDDPPITDSSKEDIESHGAAPLIVFDPVMPDGTPADRLNLYRPSYLSGATDMADKITLYDGPVTLRLKAGDIECDGQVIMRLFPKLALNFYVKSEAVPPVIGMRIGEKDDSDDSGSLILKSSGRTTSVRLTHNTYSFTGDFEGRGIFTTSPSFPTVRPTGGHESVFFVQFHVLNFQDYLGENVYLSSPGRMSVLSARTDMEFGPWVVTLDTLPDIKARKERLDEHGGCVVTHLGDLRRRDGD